MNKKMIIVTRNQSAFRNKNWKISLFSILFLVENPKIIIRNQKLKIDFNFQFCISNTKLKIDRADPEQKLMQ